MTDTILTLMTGVTIAVVSAWVTVQLSLRRFRSEQWWERKLDAYERVIAALHASKAYADRHFDVYKQTVPDTYVENLRSKAEAADDEIEKAIDIGSLLFSDQSIQRLKEYRSERDQARSSHTAEEYMKLLSQACSGCLDDFIPLAQRDLQIATWARRKLG